MQKKVVQLYVKSALGTTWTELSNVKIVSLTDIQDQEPNGYHATCTMTHELSDKGWEEFKELLQKNRRTKRSIEREKKKQKTWKRKYYQ